MNKQSIDGVVEIRTQGGRRVHWRMTPFWHSCSRRLRRRLQCDQIEKFLATNFHPSSQNGRWLFGPFWNSPLLNKNCCGNFWKHFYYILFQHLVTLDVDYIEHVSTVDSNWPNFVPNTETAKPTYRTKSTNVKTRPEQVQNRVETVAR